MVSEAGRQGHDEWQGHSIAGTCMHVRGREHGYNLKGNKGGKGLRAEWPMSPLTAPVFCVCTGAVAPPVPVEGITGGGRLRRLPLHGCRSAVQVRWAPGLVAAWSYLVRVSPDQVWNHPSHRCIIASIMVTEQGSLAPTTTLTCMSATAAAAASDSTAEGRDPSALYCQEGSIRSMGIKKCAGRQLQGGGGLFGDAA